MLRRLRLTQVAPATIDLDTRYAFAHTLRTVGSFGAADFRGENGYRSGHDGGNRSGGLRYLPAPLEAQTLNRLFQSATDGVITWALVHDHVFLHHDIRNVARLSNDHDVFVRFDGHSPQRGRTQTFYGYEGVLGGPDVILHVGRCVNPAPSLELSFGR